MTTTATIKRSTPVLFVDRIEPALAFWRDALGFQIQVEVPHGAHLGFVILTRGDVEVMYQTHASAADDMPHLGAATRAGQTFLFVEVDDLAAVEQALAKFDIVMPRRDTFYGARETGYREPGGHFVTFAQFAAQT